MLCHRCSAVFDVEAAKMLEETGMHDPRKGKREVSTASFTFEKQGVPHRIEEYRRQFRQPHQRTYCPPASVP